MNRVSTPPYATPGDGRIKVKPDSWRLTRQGQVEALPEWVPGWDPTIDLTVSCELQAREDSVLEDCQLSADARVAYCLAWASTGTTVRGCGPLTQARDDGVALSADISGVTVGDTLLLEARAVLVEQGGNPGPLAPRRRWSILWSERRATRLEGSAGRFPVEWQDFSRSGLFHPGSGWYLDWDPRDLERPVLGSIRLYLNQGHRAVREAIEARPPDEAQRVILDTIRHDIGRILITGALENSEFADPAHEYEPETLGLTLRRLLVALYGEPDLLHLSNRVQNFRSSFESGLQGRMRYLSRGRE